MPETSNYGFDIKGNPGYLRPDSDWNFLAKVVDLNVFGMITQFGENVIEGLEPSYGTLTITIGAGDGFAGGAYIVTTGDQLMTLPEGLADDTYLIYLTCTNFSTGEFSIGYTSSSVPSGSMLVAEVDVVSNIIVELRDMRTYIPIVANHDHSGGLQGPQITNTGIASNASIAGSKLNLSGYIVDGHVAGNAQIAWSKLVTAGQVVNASVSASAAIAYSKLNLTGGVVNADIGAEAAIAYSKLNLVGSILNADINASAAIAYSKLALTGSVTYADLAAGAAKMVIKDEGDILNSAVAAMNFYGSGVTVEVVDGVAEVNINGGAGVLQIGELVDVETVLPVDRQILRYNEDDEIWQNEEPFTTVTDTEIIELDPDEVKTIIFTHVAGGWGFPPVPSLTFEGAEVEAFLDLGGPFNDTQFTLKIRNLSNYSPTDLTMTYVRTGAKA